MKPLIKICGITNLEDALFAAKLDVWALGFVFADSPRKVSKNVVKNIVEKLPPYVSKVGVFVDERIDTIKSAVESCKLDMVQLHGKESPGDCKNIRRFIKVIKALRVRSEDSLKKLPEYNVDLYLLDTYSEELHGGTGRVFNWDLAVKAKKFGKNIMLAGGLNPENIVEAIQKATPYAVDVSSGVEEAPGRKNKILMEKLALKVKNL